MPAVARPSVLVAVGALAPAIVMMTVCTAAALQSQTNPTATRKDDYVPVIRSVTKLVQVNIVAAGKDGHPVTDLKKVDFNITENGKAQQIAFFNMDRIDAKLGTDSPLPPNIFSNHMGERAGVPTSVTAILLDGVNTEWADQAMARRQIVNFLKQVQPEDRIALYSLGTSLRVLHDFTTDSSELVARLNQYRGDVDAALGASQMKTIDELKSEMNSNNPSGQQQDPTFGFLARAFQLEAIFMTESRVERTLKAIEAIAEHLSGVPGRKNLIWVSGSFPLWARFDFPEGFARLETGHQLAASRVYEEWRTFGEQLTRTTRALNQANVAVYPVDARGLMAAPGYSAKESGNPPKTVWTVPNLDTMDALASSTGGRAFYNTNDIQGSIRSAIEDARVTYTLGYYPSDSKPDGKYRKINVKVKRPSVTLRYRRGYTSLKEPMLADEAADAQLRQALWSPVDATAIWMNARVDREKGSETLHITLQAVLTSVTIEQQNGMWKANLLAGFLQKDAAGRKVSAFKETVNISLNKEQYLAAIGDGLLYRTSIPRAPGAVSLKLALVDKPGAATGTVTVPLSRVAELDTQRTPPAAR